MNEALQSWMDQAAAASGVLACGVRLANRAIQVRSSRGGFREHQLIQAMRSLAEVVYGLQENRIAAERLRWMFQHSEIRCVIRPGGAMAALFVATETASLADVERLLCEAPLAGK